MLMLDLVTTFAARTRGGSLQLWQDDESVSPYRRVAEFAEKAHS